MYSGEAQKRRGDLLMVLGLLEIAIKLSPDNWSYRHIWPFLFAFYFFGLARARARYT